MALSFKERKIYSFIAKHKTAFSFNNIERRTVGYDKVWGLGKWLDLDSTAFKHFS